MTLRATIEIVPYGVEANKRELFRFDISNQGPVYTRGDECLYYVAVYDTSDNYGEEMVKDYWVRHNRKDGACELVRKALATFESEATIFEDQ